VAYTELAHVEEMSKSLEVKRRCDSRISGMASLDGTSVCRSVGRSVVEEWIEEPA
jgi:hypothetical protein